MTWAAVIVLGLYAVASAKLATAGRTGGAPISVGERALYIAFAAMNAALAVSLWREYL